MKIQCRGDLRPPSGKNPARKFKLIVKPSENHRKLRKSENREKQRKTAGNIDFLMFKIHFRSADAENH